MPAHPTPTAVNESRLDAAFGEAFDELINAWEHHHGLRRSEDLGARMAARLDLESTRRQIARHRRRLAA